MYHISYIHNFKFTFLCKEFTASLSEEIVDSLPLPKTFTWVHEFVVILSEVHLAFTPGDPELKAVWSVLLIRKRCGSLMHLLKVPRDLSFVELSSLDILLEFLSLFL